MNDVMRLGSGGWNKIPVVIFRLLKEYLSRTELLQLLNASKEVFLSIKREIIYYNLGHEGSVLYCKNIAFRNFIRAQVLNPLKQISLDLYSQHTRSLHKFYENAVDVHKLMIRDLDRTLSIDIFCNIDDLTVQNFEKLKVIRDSGTVRSLKLCDCPKLASVSGLTASLQEIIISNCHSIRSCQGFELVPSVTLEYCRNLVDVSALGPLQQNVSLIGCIKVRNIDNLGLVKRVKIVDCPQIGDVSALANVPFLELSKLDLVSSLQSLTGNREISISNLNAIAEFRFPFQSCEKIDIGATPINDVSMIDVSRCREFALRFCERVIDVSPLKQIARVRLYKCHGVLDVSCLGSVQHLSIEVCKNIRSVDGLGSVPILILSHCEKLQDISALGSNRNVTISLCLNISSLLPLQTIETVTLVHMLQLIDAHPVKYVKHLKLERCSNLTDVSMLGSVSSLQLVYCSGITSLSGLESVQSLKVVSCPIIDFANLRGKRNVTMK